VQMAVLLVLEPIFEADLQPEQYAYRPGRSAHDAVTRVEKLIGIGHREVIGADLSAYFDSIHRAELMRSVARPIADGAVLQLIKWWLVAPAYRKGARAPYREFPFLRSRMRDEFDRLWDRFSRVPNLWEGDTWRWGLEAKAKRIAVKS
jgi:Reverse transcriptase (RNA-dependent DNA polymerase)